MLYTYKTCHKHHPSMVKHVTAEQIQADHVEAQRGAVKVREGQ
jgi:hypothetical protein